MHLRIFLEPQQGVTDAQQLAIARAEEVGAIARETSRIRLGTMVLPRA